VKLDPPAGDELPRKGFAAGDRGYVPPARNGRKIAVRINTSSERLQKLAAFPAWDGKDIIGVPVLLKAKGKCTTDHISPAGKWLKYRGHLDNISNNMFTGAVNAFDGAIGIGRNLHTGAQDSFAAIARAYKAQGSGWVVVGDENYGEGSSREHAAMEPRWLSGRAIIVKSFARIHETNLKKQGMLPLTFADPADYDKVREDDRVSILGLATFAPGKPLTLLLKHADGSSEQVQVNHSFNENQIGWFKAGSALNLIASQAGMAAGRRKRTARKATGKKRSSGTAKSKRPAPKKSKSTGGAPRRKRVGMKRTLTKATKKTVKKRSRK